MSAASVPPAPAGEASPLRSVHTLSLPALLEQLGISVAVSTYQAGKLVLISARDGHADTHFSDFHVPMGLALRGNRLAIGTRLHVWEYRNQKEVAPKVEPVGRHDACFLPRACHVTGSIGSHEIAWAGTELWLVNTGFSCLCTLDIDYSFVPRWRPRFITGYSPEDRCHLNGLGLRDGQPRYVTALGQTDTAAGWRANKRSGGCLLDVPSGEVIAQGLSMPHSPRWHADQLWVLESGQGTLARVEEATGKLETVATLPGFTRGLDFCGPFAFIGLSQVRETAAFSGLSVTEPGRERACGLWVVDVRSGQTVAFLRFEELVQETFAVQVLPQIRSPVLRTNDEELIGSSFVLPDQALALVPKPTR